MATKAKMPIVVQAECTDPSEAVKVQAFLQELLAVNGAKGLLNLKARMDGSKMVRNQVMDTLKS